MYAGLLDVNVTLFLHSATKSLSNILCEIWLGLGFVFVLFFIFNELIDINKRKRKLESS